MLKEALLCLALNIYHEANTEPLAGKYAVGYVTLNRASSGIYPDNVCSVVYQSGQFSWTIKPKKPYGAGWEQAKEIASNLLYSTPSDPTNGALYFHNKEVRPKWSYRLQKTAVIGNHTFYK